MEGEKMKDDYIVDGKVARDKIAMDIIKQKLDRAGVERLCQDPAIQAAFFGAGYKDRRPRGDWDKDYLDYLFCAVANDCFDRDYLLHLAEVAEYVSKAPSRKGVVAGVVIVLVIVLGIVAYRLGGL